MSKRKYQDFMLLEEQCEIDISKRKYQNFILDNDEEQHDVNLYLLKISLLLENINVRLEKCETSIKYLADMKIKEEQEKLEQEKHDDEIYRSYIN